MNEREWLSARSSPLEMIEGVLQIASERKLRLLACACALASGIPLGDAERRIISMGERYADEPSDCDIVEVRRTVHRDTRYAGLWLTIADNVRDRFLPVFGHEYLLWADKAYCSPIRDIFGNPFRPVAFDPSWRTEAAVGIARGIYEDRAFERMPILADALEEAGCCNVDILSHCREPGEHVRGCWVVDLVLGKV